MATLNPTLPVSTIATELDARAVTELDALLRRAAALAASHGVSLDTFAEAAWAAFLDAQPGLREELEVRALAARLDELRGRGLVGSA